MEPRNEPIIRVPRGVVDKPPRVRLRLKHSMAVGEEIHCVIPHTLEEWEAALARGELKEIPGMPWRDLFRPAR